MSKIQWAAAVVLAALLPSGVAAAATPPHTVVASPRPEIGALSTGPAPTDHFCSASIVASPKGNVIATAAHCVAGKANVYFTPGYHDGKAPYGTWESAATYIDPGWKTSHDIDGAGSPYDYAFLVLRPRNGKNVAEVTGASLTLKIDQTLPSPVSVFGYPSGGQGYQDKLYVGDSTASRDGRYWEILQCTGIPDGYSGGPWIVGGRNLIGVIGGKGQNLPASDPRNYSVRFDGRVKALYDKAIAAARTQLVAP
jgi:V8-like Glu-specific endopeptidase